ncbi:hypothetical protein [Streptomyces alkaliphilus]|uniref:hypothetical protein n=1 Tax=Streptomyces alkaliphilus TaxID=1472722 RepID=UPI001295EC34|nr:hypothetical protein [Streptomyces alkaliphilus]
MSVEGRGYEVRVPRAFAEATIRREGPPGEAWIHRPPAPVADLLRKWGPAADGPD